MNRGEREDAWREGGREGGREEEATELLSNETQYS